MVELNSMENVTIAISMVIELMNAKRNLNLKENFTNARNMGTNLLNVEHNFESNIKNCGSYIWLGLQHMV